MIQLEHVNLVVKDLKQSLRFYQAAFPHWKIRIKGRGDWYGKPRNWMHFGDDYQYIAFSDHGEGKNRDLEGHQVGLAHFAYVTDDIKAVTDRLVNAGFEIDNDGKKTEYRENVYFIDPDGFEVEFVEYKSDLPILRNSE
ncbi:MAG: VOC family protein [bacterium]